MRVAAPWRQQVRADGQRFARADDAAVEVDAWRVEHETSLRVCAPVRYQRPPKTL
jgi:hypothetical protein